MYSMHFTKCLSDVMLSTAHELSECLINREICVTLVCHILKGDIILTATHMHVDLLYLFESNHGTSNRDVH